jgi:hypothetical protein
MAENDLTLSVLAGLEAGGPDLPIKAAERQQLVEKLRAKASEVIGLPVPDMGERLLGVLAQQMRKPVAELLREYWKQRAEMRDVAAKKGNEREVVGEVELIDWSLTWSLEPSIKVYVKKQHVATLRAEVKSTLALSGIKLVMRNACVTEIKSGKVDAKTEFTFEGLPLPTMKRSTTLPGKLTLPGGGLCLT